jgi:predicted RNA-binding protein with PIN domain
MGPRSDPSRNDWRVSSMARPLLVVDAANVIGARPDGWWRDRAAAAQRLLTALSRKASDDENEIVVVLEGAARKGADPGAVGGLQVVHAPASGDDAIVDVVADATESSDARQVTVVTADRGLRERVTALGATTMGPRTLWEQLDHAAGGLEDS